MTEPDFHPTVGEALGILIEGLSPFVDRVFAGVLSPSVAWPEVLRRKDEAASRRVGAYRSGDLSLQLRAMTERMGALGYPFSGHLSRTAQNYASELRDVRNRWAHNEPFTAEQAYRALDSADLLLRAIGADDRAHPGSQVETPVCAWTAHQARARGSGRRVEAGVDTDGGPFRRRRPCLS